MIFRGMKGFLSRYEYNGACLLLQMEEKRRKYSISSDNSDTTDSKACRLGPLRGKPMNNHRAQGPRGERLSRSQW